jgi:hypothetical protein
VRYRLVPKIEVEHLPVFRSQHQSLAAFRTFFRADLARRWLVAGDRQHFAVVYLVLVSFARAEIVRVPLAVFAIDAGYLRVKQLEEQPFL